MSPSSCAARSGEHRGILGAGAGAWQPGGLILVRLFDDVGFQFPGLTGAIRAVFTLPG